MNPHLVSKVSTQRPRSRRSVVKTVQFLKNVSAPTVPFAQRYVSAPTLNLTLLKK